MKHLFLVSFGSGSSEKTGAKEKSAGYQRGSGGNREFGEEWALSSECLCIFIFYFE